jgi:hypothetical protein
MKITRKEWPFYRLCLVEDIECIGLLTDYVMKYSYIIYQPTNQRTRTKDEEHRRHEKRKERNTRITRSFSAFFCVLDDV